jgi:ankyrin repeat protein
MLLLEHGANVEKTGDYCKTPLQKAAQRGNIAAVQELIQKAAFPDRGISSDANLTWFIDNIDGWLANVEPEYVNIGLKGVFSLIAKVPKIINFAYRHLPLIHQQAAPAGEHDRAEQPAAPAGNANQAPEQPAQPGGFLNAWDHAFRNIPVDEIPENLLALAIDHMQAHAADRVNEKRLAILHLLCMSPINYAIIEGHTAITKYLLDNGARIDLPGMRGMHPIHFAAKYGREADLELLLSIGADVNVEDDNSMTPLHYAAHYGHLNIIAKLLEYHADAAKCNDAGQTPFHEACKNRHENVARLLLQNTEDKDALVVQCDNNHNIPLHYAAANGDESMIRFLISYNNHASIRSQDGRGRTPRQCAIDAGHLDLAPLLEFHLLV